MEEEILIAKNISKKYKGRKERALEQVSISIKKGEFISIIGISGSGKSTLLNILGTLDSYDEGEIEYKFNNLNENRNIFFNSLKIKLRKKIGFIFQTPFMLSNFSVFDNIAIPLIILGEDDESINKKVNDMLKKLDLSHRAYDTADRLSGGERQRVVIGRALIHSPYIVFADEPTGNLDVKTSENVIRYLFNICKEIKASLVLVTHSSELALKCERIIGINDGRIIFDLNNKFNLREYSFEELRNKKELLFYKNELEKFIKESKLPQFEIREKL